MGKLDEAALLDLAARMYEAAAEPERWPGVMEACCRAAEAHAAGGGGALTADGLSYCRYSLPVRQAARRHCCTCG